MHKLLRRLIVS